MEQERLTFRIMVALLFAIAFTLIGWTAPVLYATHAPQDSFIEVSEFSAQNASADAEQHYICLDRDVKQPTSATVYTELYLIRDSGERVEVAGGSESRYFQGGDAKVVTPLDLPEDLRDGEYRYLLVVQMDLADGRVERAFTFSSEPFYIGYEHDPTPTRAEFGC